MVLSMIFNRAACSFISHGRVSPQIIQAMASSRTNFGKANCPKASTSARRPSAWFSRQQVARRLGSVDFSHSLSVATKVFHTANLRLNSFTQRTVRLLAMRTLKTQSTTMRTCVNGSKNRPIIRLNFRSASGNTTFCRSYRTFAAASWNVVAAKDRAAGTSGSYTERSASTSLYSRYRTNCACSTISK